MPQSLNGEASVWKTDGRSGIGLQVRILSAAFGKKKSEDIAVLARAGRDPASGPETAFNCITSAGVVQSEDAVSSNLISCGFKPRLLYSYKPM